MNFYVQIWKWLFSISLQMFALITSTKNNNAENWSSNPDYSEYIPCTSSKIVGHMGQIAKVQFSGPFIVIILVQLAYFVNVFVVWFFSWFRLVLKAPPWLGQNRHRPVWDYPMTRDSVGYCEGTAPFSRNRPRNWQSQIQDFSEENNLQAHDVLHGLVIAFDLSLRHRVV